MRFYAFQFFACVISCVTINSYAHAAEHLTLRHATFERQKDVKLNGQRLTLDVWDMSQLDFAYASDSRAELTAIFQTLMPGMAAAAVSTKAFLLYDANGELVAAATWKEGAPLGTPSEERVLNKMAVKEAFWGDRATALSALTARLMHASDVPLKIANPIQVYGTSTGETETLRKTMRSQFAIAWNSVSMTLANMIILNACTFIGSSGGDF